MSAPRPFAALLFALTVFSGERSARANCTPPGRQSSCLDADELWIPAAPTNFVGIAAASAPAAHTWALGFAATYLSRPIVLSARSPDPSGRDVRVVDDVLDATLVAAYAPAPHLELSLAAPFAAYRTGAGLSGVATQTGPSLPATVFGDVRLGAGYDLDSETFARGKGQLSLMSRLELSLPTGDSDAFAGARGPVLAPSIDASLRFGIFFASAAEGARLREPVELGGARLGTQIVSSLGVGVDVLPRGRLSVALEGWVMPSPLSQDRTLLDGTRVSEATLVPAEWLASAKTQIGPISLLLGGGSAIALSDETRTPLGGSPETNHFAGLTAPRFRFTFVVRYAATPSDRP